MSTRYNNGLHYENHQRAAELHEAAAHAHRSAEEAHEKQDHQTGQERSRQALEHSQKAHQHSGQAHRDAVNEHGIAISGTRTSPYWPTRCGKQEAVRRDRRKKTGSTPRRNCGPARRFQK